MNTLYASSEVSGMGGVRITWREEVWSVSSVSWAQQRPGYNWNPIGWQNDVVDDALVNPVNSDDPE